MPRRIFSSENEFFFILPPNKLRPFLRSDRFLQNDIYDDDEEDNIVPAQVITPEITRTTTRYLPRIGIYYSMLLTMKMIKLMDFHKLLRLKCYFFLVQS